MKVLDKIFGENWQQEKKDWREFRSAIKALPKDYRQTYKAIEKYVYQMGWPLEDWIVFKELLELFQLSVLDGRSARQFVGEDLAAFCNYFFDKEITQNSYLDQKRKKLNEYFAKR
ncbi:MAG: DUF1048 domain-containing protein [Lactovum sp.]